MLSSLKEITVFTQVEKVRLERTSPAQFVISNEVQRQRNVERYLSERKGVYKCSFQDFSFRVAPVEITS